MKIIDILVNIAGNKEVPKKIEYDDTIYVYDSTDKAYYVEKHRRDSNYSLLRDLFHYIQTDIVLNSEVEVLEDNSIKELEYSSNLKHLPTEGLSYIMNYLLSHEQKINELVREINKLK